MADHDDPETEQLADPHHRHVVYTLPEMEDVLVTRDITYKSVEENDLKLDIYYPARHYRQRTLPAVIFIHGDGTPEFLKDIKESGQYSDWGKLVAATGMIAVTANHRSTQGLHNIVGAANDVDDLISYVRDHSADLQIDAERLCIWVCSAGGPLGLRAALYEAPPYIRGIVCYYGFPELRAYYTALYNPNDEDEPIATPPALNEDDFDEFSATELLLRRPADVAPIFIARAGMDYDELNDALDAFVSTAIAQNASLTFMNHPTGQHAFDLLDNDERSREIIKATLDFLQTQLFT